MKTELELSEEETDFSSEEESLEEDYDDNDDDYFDEYGDENLSPIDKHKDLLRDLTNFAPYLKDSVNNWLGLSWDEATETLIRNPLIKPIMNVKGAAWCVGLLKTYTRSNNIITDIGKDEYKDIMGDHISAIWLNLGTRSDLGIKEDGDLIRVANELEHAAALVLMGAGDGRYNKFLGTTISRHETVNPLAQRDGYVMTRAKKGVFGKVREVLIGT